MIVLPVLWQEAVTVKAVTVETAMKAVARQVSNNYCKGATMQDCSNQDCTNLQDEQVAVLTQVRGFQFFFPDQHICIR